MIKNLLASCLISASVNTTPITRDNTQWQTAYNINILTEDRTSNDIADGYESRNLYNISKRMYQKFTDYLDINMTVYKQERMDNDYVKLIEEQNKNLDIEFSTVFDSQNPIELYIIQVKPKVISINNTITIDLLTGYFNQLNPTEYNQSNVRYAENYIKYQIIQTTTDITQYMNINPSLLWQGTTKLANVLNQIKNGTNGYQTNTRYGYLTPPEDEQDDTGTQTITYTITPNKMNYYVLARQCSRYRLDQPENLSTYYLEKPVLNLNSEFIRFAGTSVINQGNQEVVDIPGVMFDVIGMPFTFISTAFNITLFPGTAYEVNISMLFLTIFALLSFVFILKIFLRMKG